ncbi:hypothetical protein NUU61_003247 [Penicillium alfredii]|uniref:Major facilitator superfamily (MFS) profile domain-containing protein n=1 Tax=Penicillium alfredii TaxID=1506179 RepID=A0A9W9KGR0_9EURO|nr:uncharacterized protein NUU61_003247 [Penicillium alfredii]KAJ5105900.1 hypothetical protein NUU61_003247 [Penicillium alfredii]
MAKPTSSSSDHIETIAPPEKEHHRELEDINAIPLGWFIWVVAFTASIAGLLFGYDTGIISAVLVYIGNDLGGRAPTHSEKELITSLCSAGAFFGAICAGMTADKFGRKNPIYVGCFLFTIGAALQASAYTIAQMAVGRFVVGLGVGSAAMIVPLYVAELAPAQVRGRLIGLNNISITGGQVLSYAIGAAFASVDNGWRYMVGLGGVPSIILACLLPWCPQSPRQLVYKGRVDEARSVLRRIYGQATEHQIEIILGSIQDACNEARRLNENESKWDKIVQLHRVPANFRALFSACGLMVMSQMSGFNTLMYYSSTLFSMVGFDQPVAVGLIVAAPNLAMAFLNVLLVDRLGRRRLLLYTSWGMCAGLIAVAIAFAFLPVDTETLEVHTGGTSTEAIVILVFVLWFVLFYGVSVGNTAWMSADFFPLEVRSMGTMWMTCSTWVSNVIVSSTFLSMMQTMTPSGTFGFYAGICGLGWVWIYFFYPEVSGLQLEEIRGIFERGYGKSMRSRKAPTMELA